MVRVVAVLAVLLALVGRAAAVEHFVYTSAGDFETAAPLLERSDISGVQVVYNWRMLEPQKGAYDFSRIEEHLAAAEAVGKALVIQVQDRFFAIEAKNVPDYLLSGPEFGGGLAPQVENAEEAGSPAYGWVAQQWNPAVRERYQALLAALAEAFDGRVLAVNLPETAVDVSLHDDTTGFTCDGYFEAEMDNFRFARSVFETTKVVLYTNFWPCEWENDHDYMGRAFAYAAEAGAGLGGPDIVPYRPGQMKNSYPFFNQYKGQLAWVGLAVQEPTLEYVNPETGKPFTKDEFVSFATDFLGADAIFWAVSTPWLQSP